MLDREKVIKGLECCQDCDGYTCRNCCPYHDRNEPKDQATCTCHLAHDALALLTAQEPVRPGLGIIHHDDGSKIYFLHCPFDGTTLDEGDKYCRKCGRAVKWE